MEEQPISRDRAIPNTINTQNTEDHLHKYQGISVLQVGITHRQSGQWGFADIFPKVVLLELYQLNDQCRQAFASWWICLHILKNK